MENGGYGSYSHYVRNVALNMVLFLERHVLNLKLNKKIKFKLSDMLHYDTICAGKFKGVWQIFKFNMISGYRYSRKDIF